MPILAKLFPKTAEKEMLMNSFYEPSITPIPKSDRYHIKRKLEANNPDKHRDKNSQQNISRLNSAIHLKDHAPCTSRIYP